MRIIISCGGTGGHIYPGIAVAQRLKDTEILFVGSKERLEESIVSKYGFKFKSITMDRINIFKIFKGIIESLKLLNEFKPDIVFSTGGYVTLPVAISTVIKRIPLVLHEANAIPGRTNRFLGKLAAKVATTYASLEKYFAKEKIIQTGMPLRIEITKKINKKEALSKLGLKEGYTNILMLGGSQGAQYLNDTLVESLEVFKDKQIQFICLTGDKEFSKIKENIGKALNVSNFELVELGESLIKLMPYFEDMDLLYAVSDLIISRAGANTLAEAAYLGLPQVVIPYPYAKDNHQIANAMESAKLHKILIIEQKELSVETFVSIITQFFQKKGFFKFLKEIKPQVNNIEDSSEKVIKVIKECLQKK